MPHHLNVFPDLILLVVSVVVQSILAARLLRRPGWRSLRGRLPVSGAFLILASLETFGYLLGFQRVSQWFPVWMATWLQAFGMISAVLTIGVFLGAFIFRRAPEHDPTRRRIVETVGAVVASAPFAGIAAGIAIHDRFRMSEVEIKVPGLPKDLDGLRLVQITDIHLSPFLSERQFARAIDMANETKAHLALVTGDLITRTGDPLDACLRQLTRLRAEAGTIGCLGNHEVYTDTEDYVELRGRLLGMDFLRGRARSFRFGNASIRFAGVDYQPFGRPYLRGAETLIAPGEFNVLLSHNPDVFRVAAAQGYDLTIAGHTHGGQVNFEILHKNVNVALVFTPFVRGLYRAGNSSIYVSSGLGTIGVPVRLGAPAEVSLIKLCAT